MKTITTDEFIERVSKRARFAKNDTKIILDTIIIELEEAVKNETEVKLRSLGHLMLKKVKSRKIRGYVTKTGEMFPEKELPETDRIVFRLSENIRYAKKR